MMLESHRLYRKPEILNDLVSYIGFLRTSEEYCDAIFNCCDGQVVAHKLILGTRSRVIRNTTMEEDIEILTPDFSTHVIRQMLDFLYNGTVCSNQEENEGIHALLRLLGVECTFDQTALPNRKQKLKIKHENNLSSRKLIPEVKPNRKKRIFTANLDISDLTCDVCYKVFPKLYKLKNHQLIHLNSFPFICSDCGKGFKNKYKLNSHEKDHKQGTLHPERKKEEKEKKLPKTRIFPCKHCGEEFRRGIDRTSHINQNHRITVSHSCFHCASKFGTKKKLIAHLRVVHNDLEGVLRHVCPICGKRFLKPSHLEDHQARHNPIGQHPCMYCPKRCATKQDLDRHLASHRGEANLTCQLCFKAFVHRSTYTEHVRKHLGQKPYVCKPCNKNYSQFKSLRQHQKAHEKKGDRTMMVVPSKGSRGCHSYIDVITEPTIVTTTEQKQKDLSTQVYIPGPQYNKSTGYKTNQQTTTTLKQQIETEYAEISRFGFQFQDVGGDGYPSMVEIDQMFEDQTLSSVNQTIITEHDLS